MICRPGFYTFHREHAFGLTFPQKFALKLGETCKWQRLIRNVDFCRSNHGCGKSECKNRSRLDLAAARFNKNAGRIAIYVLRLRGTGNPRKDKKKNDKGNCPAPEISMSFAAGQLAVFQGVSDDHI